MIVVIIPRITEDAFTTWFNNEDLPENRLWLNDLPAVFVSLLNGTDDPEQNCTEDRWKDVDGLNSQFHPGATYDDEGILITPEQGVAAGTADRIAPDPLNSETVFGHIDEDVMPFIRAAQLDGNPVESTFDLFTFRLNLTEPLMHEGANLKNYLKVRPTIANSLLPLFPCIE